MTIYITHYKSTLMCFEVGVRGFLTKENTSRLKLIHSLYKKSVKLKTFLENISALSIVSSYYIFTARKKSDMGETGYIHPPF